MFIQLWSVCCMKKKEKIKILCNLCDVFQAEKENAVTLIACVVGVCLVHLFKMTIIIYLLRSEFFSYMCIYEDAVSQVQSWLRQTREFCFLLVLIWILCPKAKPGGNISPSSRDSSTPDCSVCSGCQFRQESWFQSAGRHCVQGSRP